jgi:hypothetical protein
MREDYPVHPTTKRATEPMAIPGAGVTAVPTRPVVGLGSAGGVGLGRGSRYHQ